MKYTIRDYKSSDKEELVALTIDTIKNVNRSEYTVREVEAWSDYDRINSSFDNLEDKVLFFVCIKDDEISGYIDLKVNGEIDKLFVKKEFVGCGVGGLLYKTLEAKSHELGFKKLNVFSSKTAYSFFRKMGFKEVRENIVNINGLTLNNFFMEKYISSKEIL